MSKEETVQGQGNEKISVEEVGAKDELLDTKAGLDRPDNGSTPFDDDKTSRAIDDIVVNESDELLTVQDTAAESPGAGVSKSTTTHWWSSKWFRWIVLLLIFGGATAAMAVPTSRYWLLNTAGVRVSASVTVVDDTTQLPLKGVAVSMGGRKAETNSEGKATVRDLRLGSQSLTVEQIGFASSKRAVVLGWGSNPLDKVALKAVGVQYVIEVRDYLSDKPLEGVEATSGEATALSGKDGKITLTLANPTTAKDSVSLSKATYRTEQVTLDAEPQATTKAALVLARKVVFVSKSGGKSDVVKSDIDGRSRVVLLAGTGHENSNISLVSSPDGSRAALVSTRDNKRDAGGFLLSSLVLINTEDGSAVTIAESPQIQLVDWIGPQLVFQQVASDSSDPSRYKVIAYNHTANTRVQLAAANKLNAVESAQGVIYVAVADVEDSSFFKINPDGTGKQTVLNQGVRSVLRTTYNALSLQAADDNWYSYELASIQAEQVDSPGSLINRSYIDNADRSKSLWVSQGALTIYDPKLDKATVLHTQSGLTYPVYWLSSNVLVYRLATTIETADYAISLDGGSAHKVADVLGSYGFSRD